MKIAIAQFCPQWENKNLSMKKAKEWIEKASKMKADYILFPELSLTGFSMKVEAIRDQIDETSDFIRENAERYQIGIGMGYVPSGSGLGRNCYQIRNLKGEIILDYTKIHPFSYGKENHFYESGQQVVTGMMSEVPVGIGICYDLRFPELFRAMMPFPHLILIPANWPKARIEQWKILLKARAVENQAYVIGINCVGMLDQINYSGESMVISPLGTSILTGEQGKEELLIWEMDDQVGFMREKFPVLKDRKGNEFWQNSSYTKIE